MARVFITQEVMVRDFNGELKHKFDLGKAAQFGEIKILISSSQNAVSIVPVMRQLLEQMKDFGEDDYLLPVGAPAVMAAASAVAAKYNDGRFKIIQWDRRMGAYVPIQIDLSGRMQ